MCDSDRTVHGRTREGYEVVRYSRAGKWFIETSSDTRQLVTMKVAAKLTAHGGTHVQGLPGGQSFDRVVQSIQL